MVVLRLRTLSKDVSKQNERAASGPLRTATAFVHQKLAHVCLGTGYKSARCEPACRLLQPLRRVRSPCRSAQVKHDSTTGGKPGWRGVTTKYMRTPTPLDSALLIVGSRGHAGESQCLLRAQWLQRASSGRGAHGFPYGPCRDVSHGICFVADTIYICIYTHSYQAPRE